MSDDRTVIRPLQPKYEINQTVYARVSATKGYVEPLYIHNVSFDPGAGKYLYSFRREPRRPVFNTEDILIPVKLYEEQLVNLCEATDIQISVLERDYQTALKLLQNKCPGVITPYQVPLVFEDHLGRVQPPNPRFGVNSIVYLLESASASGFLEAKRISSLVWNNDRKQWMYQFTYQVRPEHTMTIGDADNWRNYPVVYYLESELGIFCEAQDLVVKSLDRALANAKWRRDAICGAGTGTSVTDLTGSE
jgi:hypothetical protein